MFILCCCVCFLYFVYPLDFLRVCCDVICCNVRCCVGVVSISPLEVLALQVAMRCAARPTTGYSAMYVYTT